MLSYWQHGGQCTGEEVICPYMGWVSSLVLPKVICGHGDGLQQEGCQHDELGYQRPECQRGELSRDISNDKGKSYNLSLALTVNCSMHHMGCIMADRVSVRHGSKLTVYKTTRGMSDNYKV